MLLRIGFFKDISKFLKENEGLLVSKIEQTSMLSSRVDFSEKPFFLRKAMILKDLGIEVKIKDRSKID